MAYALFSQSKLSLHNRLVTHQLEQTMCADTQFMLATRSMGIDQEISSLQTSQASELADLYNKLADAGANSEVRDDVQAAIRTKEAEFERDINKLNNDIYKINAEEKTIELRIKKLDTKVSVMQSRLEQMEKAEGEGINRAMPKYTGVG